MEILLQKDEQHLRWRRRSRAVAPASWASAASPAALAGGQGARPGSASSPLGDGVEGTRGHAVSEDAFAMPSSEQEQGDRH